MRALFSVLIISVLSSLSVLGEETTSFRIGPSTAMVHRQDDMSGRYVQHEAPRRKVKKKRTTILNRKTKRGHGHHCPSF
ncbi:MAG: hypothetical protein ABJC12_11050 [Saprospiraceae bacterium]